MKAWKLAVSKVKSRIRWVHGDHKVDRLAKIVAMVVIVAVGMIVLSDVLALLDSETKDLIKVVAPAVVLGWAVYQPGYQVRLQREEADRRRDEERNEMRATAAAVAFYAANDLANLTRGVRRYVHEGKLWTTPRIEEHREALDQFEAKTMPDATLLVALHKLRGVLAEAQKLYEEEIAGRGEEMLPSKADVTYGKLEKIYKRAHELRIEIHERAYRIDQASLREQFGDDE